MIDDDCYYFIYVKTGVRRVSYHSFVSLFVILGPSPTMILLVRPTTPSGLNPTRPSRRVPFSEVRTGNLLTHPQ